MNETQLYEALGRKQMAFETLDAAYTALLGLLAKVVSDEISPTRVIVDLTNRAWAVSEPGTRPGLPATINGLPVCVVAPEPVASVPGGPRMVPPEEATELNPSLQAQETAPAEASNGTV